MKLDVADDHVVVVSDLHLGSPVSNAQHRLPAFLDHVERTGANLCINGDGIDLLHGSVASLLGAALPIVRRLRSLQASGRRIYYTIGNHDIAFEHLLADLPLHVAPFLNLTSGAARIRIEHGHVYEPFFARHPDLYELGGRLSRPFLWAAGDVYKLWSAGQSAVDRRRRRDGEYPHHAAATALFERGFDAVVLGHTHHPERTELPGGVFANCGGWMSGGTWIEIRAGDISLHTWPDA